MLNFETDIKNNILNGLNPAQSRAVQETGLPLLVLAGAGSGKTKVLTHRIAYMIANGINPANILAVTFTNKAAKEMKARVVKLVGEEHMKNCWLGTFHSVCMRILRMDIDKMEFTETKQKQLTKNFVIFDETDSVNTVKEAIKALDLDPKIYVPKVIKNKISNAKNEGKMAKDFSENVLSNYRDEKIGLIFNKYEELMLRNNALDFDDLLLFTVKLLQENKDIRKYYSDRFKHVLVDEYQDTNHIQYEMVRLLAEGCLKNEREDIDYEQHWHHRTLTVVGDVDQSIYSWRGADYKIIVGFQNDFPKSAIVKLEENYRSTANILQVADTIISNNEERIEKNLIATKGRGDKITVFEAQDELEEAHYIADEIRRQVMRGKSLRDCAVLYRTNVQSRAIEEAFIKRGMPYQIIGGFRFYDRKEIKDIMAYLKMIYNPSDGQSLKRVINEPRRGIGATTVAKVEDFAEERGYSLYRTMLEIDEVDNINSSAQNKIRGFVDLIEELRLAEKSLPLSDLVEMVIEKTGYGEMLSKSSDADAEDRMENLHELIGVAADFELNSEDESLGAFLTETALLTDADGKEKNGDSVSMMTLHSAKGLEFGTVVLAGMEEGIFPHQRSLNSNDPSELEEERRLMYVGVTRAEEKLYLTYARRRRIFGQSDFTIPSRFLEEAPAELLSGYYGQSNSNERGSRFKREEYSNDRVDDVQVQKRNVEKGYSSEPFYDDVDGGTVLRRKTKDSIPNNETAHGVSPRAKWGGNSDMDYVAKANAKIQEANKPEFEAGDRVKHDSFGEGVILQALGAGAKVLYNVEFPEIGAKKLLDPKFAKLVKISD
jgi:DNA helicase-2/ATP-dependent DNA helicase PcrA